MFHKHTLIYSLTHLKLTISLWFYAKSWVWSNILPAASAVCSRVGPGAGVKALGWESPNCLWGSHSGNFMPWRLKPCLFLSTRWRCPNQNIRYPGKSVGKKLCEFDKPHTEMREGAVFLGTQERLSPNLWQKNEVITAAAQEGSDGKIMLIHRGGGEFQPQKVMKFQSWLILIWVWLSDR